MKGIIVSVAVAAMILAVSPIQAANSAARVPESDSRVTAGLNHQSLQAAQTGKALQATEPRQSKSAESKTAKAKALRRNYAIRAHMAKQKAQLAKAKKSPLKAKKQLAKSKKQSPKAKKKQAV